MMKKIIIIGAGISGLATAFWLKQKGYEVQVLEKMDHTGGVIGTINEKGFLFEKGPNSFLDNTAETLELCEDAALETEIIKQPMRSNKRYIYLDGKLNEVPTGPGGLFTSPLFTKQARRKLFSEAFRGGNRSPEDESLASFIRRRFGEDILNNLVTPFVSGVYAGDPEKLSLRGTFGILYDLERSHGSVIRGMIAKGFSKKKKEGEKKKKRAKNLCSFIDGMGVLTHTLNHLLNNSVRKNSEVESIQKNESGGFSVKVKDVREPFTGDAIVMAVPSYVCAAMCKEFLAESSDYLESIPYNRLNVVGIGYKKEDIKHNCDGFGYLVPRNQGVRILGSIWSSSLFPRRSPGGLHCFTVFIGGGLDPAAYSLSDEDLLAQVREDLQKTVGIKGEPQVCKIFRWEYAIPQYPIGHVEKVEAMDKERLKTPGLFLTGNYIDGVSVNDCIRKAKETVGEVDQFFQNLSG